MVRRQEAQGRDDLSLLLTEREQEILRLLAQGLTNSAIAERLGLSTKTIRNRVSDIFAKLQVADRYYRHAP